MGAVARESIDELAKQLQTSEKKDHINVIQTITALSRQKEYCALQHVFSTVHTHLDTLIGTQATDNIIYAFCSVADNYNRIKHEQEEPHAKEAFHTYLHS
jgi:hypothetical protein